MKLYQTLAPEVHTHGLGPSCDAPTVLPMTTTSAAPSVIEVALATGYKLYRRHTEPGEYAVTAIEHYERLYLTPE